MLPMTTTPAIDGKTPRTYLGIVSGEVVLQSDWVGRLAGETIHDARVEAMAQMSARAAKLGASAVIGVDFDYELTPALRLVIATGTAVVL